MNVDSIYKKLIHLQVVGSTPVDGDMRTSLVNDL